MATTFLDHLNWRFAAKDFDTSKPVSEENLNKILEAVHMAPSSYGVQPYHVYVVQNPEVKTQLRAAGYNQPQFENGTVLVFCSRNDVKQRINKYAELASGGDEAIKEKLSGYLGMMRGDLENRNPEQIKTWADKQAYIALGFAMAAAAELEVDSCPMEGFQPAEFDKILQVPEHMKSVVCLTLGHRTQDPTHGKTRYSMEDLVSRA